MSKKRTTYTSSFKAKVALAAVKPDKTIAQLAAQFNVHPQVVAKWKAQLLDNIASVFEDGRKKKPGNEPNTDELYKQIGQLKVELDFVKKKSAEFR
jgi:transposase-like protein